MPADALQARCTAAERHARDRHDELSVTIAQGIEDEIDDAQDALEEAEQAVRVAHAQLLAVRWRQVRGRWPALSAAVLACPAGSDPAQVAALQLGGCWVNLRRPLRELYAARIPQLAGVVGDLRRTLPLEHCRVWRQELAFLPVLTSEPIYMHLGAQRVGFSDHRAFG